MLDEFYCDAHPEQIYNMDETSVPLEPRSPKVVAQKDKERSVAALRGRKHKLQLSVVEV